MQNEEVDPPKKKWPKKEKKEKKAAKVIVLDSEDDEPEEEEEVPLTQAQKDALEKKAQEISDLPLPGVKEVKVLPKEEGKNATISVDPTKNPETD